MPSDKVSPLTPELQLPAPESRTLATALWSTFKTILFATVMISDTVLSSLVYISPAIFPSAPHSARITNLADTFTPVFRRGRCHDRRRGRERTRAARQSPWLFRGRRDG